jgi:hypothetical protein
VAWRTVAAGGRRPQAAAGGHPPQAAVHVFSVYEREWGHPSSLVVLHKFGTEAKFQKAKR